LRLIFENNMTPKPQSPSHTHWFVKAFIIAAVTAAFTVVTTVAAVRYQHSLEWDRERERDAKQLAVERERDAKQLAAERKRDAKELAAEGERKDKLRVAELDQRRREVMLLIKVDYQAAGRALREIEHFEAYSPEYFSAIDKMISQIRVIEAKEAELYVKYPDLSVPDRTEGVWEKATKQWVGYAAEAKKYAIDRKQFELKKQEFELEQQKLRK
jgi:hypothetical protein